MADMPDLKARNLEFFKERAPQLHQQMLNFEPLSQLVLDENSEPDVVFRGQRFYDGRVREHVAGQLENFKRNPNRILLVPPQSDAFDDVAKDHFHTIMAEASESGIEFLLRPRETTCYTLVILGVGLGLHLQALIEATECHAVVIAEQNLEFFYHSLSTCDWSAVNQLIQDKGGEIHFCFDGNPETLAFRIRTTVRSISPMAIDGLQYFIHHASPVFERTVALIRRDVQLVLAGLGFYYDETLMIRNAHHNLRGGKSKVYRRPRDHRIDVPVFILGSGPSLDRDLGFIKENRDKAILISCGSTIQVLLTNGIVPDFQIEIENLAVKEIIDPLAQQYDLSPICLITSSTVEPDSVHHFGRVLFFARSSLSPFPIFSRTSDECLLNPNPTVVNAGLSFAQEIGFRNFYLFGTDMGTRVPELHHSKFGYQWQEGAVHTPQTFDIPTPGNFGGTVLSSHGLYWARDSIIKAIKENTRGRSYINCSDGAYIEGTQAKKSRSVKLPEIAAGKRDVIDEILGLFPCYTAEEFLESWTDAYFRQSMNAFIDELLEIEAESDSFMDKSYITRLMQKLDLSALNMRTGMALLFRGTIFMFLLGAEFYLNRVKDPEQDMAFSNMVKSHFRQLLNELRDKADEDLSELDREAEDRERAVAHPA